MISRAFNPLKYLDKKKSVILLGPRGTGKTALINSIVQSKQAKPGRGVLTIDLLSGGDFQRYVGHSDQLTKEVSLLVKQNRDKDSVILVTIDEIQKIPGLLDEVHLLIEQYKNKVVFLLTGSSARKLKRGGANLLAGRAISCNYYPLSQLEINIDLIRALQYGTMPGIYLDETDLEIPTLESYVSTYLREEIQQESLVRGIERFARFLEIAAQVNGQPINFSKIGKSIKVAGKTIADYYGILKDTLLAFEIPGWSESVRRQLLQAPRYYFFDCGVLNAINGYLRIDLRRGGNLYGNLFETFIVSQLIASNDYQSLGLRFYYWRDREGREVDLILARNQFEPLLAIEIKASSTPDEWDCPGLKVFAEEYPNIKRICACTSPRGYEANGVRFLPWQDVVTGLKHLLEQE